jgi:probable rRNA maturation factor
VLRNEGFARGEVSVVFTDDRLSRRINRRYLAHDRPTDVISFPLGTDEFIEGELYVNIDKAARQARTWKVSTRNELVRLVVHGTLHLTGYDDRTARAAKRMKTVEDAYVQLLGGKEA